MSIFESVNAGQVVRNYIPCVVKAVATSGSRPLSLCVIIGCLSSSLKHNIGMGTQSTAVTMFAQAKAH